MNLRTRSWTILVVLLAAAFLAACRPVTKEAAQVGPPVLGDFFTVQLAQCDGNTCTDTDGYEYTCDGNTCTDTDGYVYTCNADGLCQSSDNSTAGAASPDASTAASSAASTEAPTAAEPAAGADTAAATEAAPTSETATGTDPTATPEPTAAEPTAADPTATPAPAAVEPTATAEAAAPAGGPLSAAAINDIVAAHNRYRAEVGVPDLTWSDTVAASAQQWANTLAANNSFEHDTQRRYGENLFMGSGDRPGTQAVTNWGNEKANYNGEAIGEGNFSAYGHYTQMVWRGTKEVGCASAKTGDGSTVWVCRYDPPGNMSGEKPF